MDERDSVLAGAERLLKRQTPLLDRRELDAFVGSFTARREDFLRAQRKHGSPLYLVEKQVLRTRADEFAAAFRSELPEVDVYYAVKSNNCPAIVTTLLEAGVGLDVSSGVELELALAWGATHVVFSGPGKTEDELLTAARNGDCVTVLLDSFGELDRLERVAACAGVTVRTGVRLTTDERGLWRKFGIPLSKLHQFMDLAETCRHVRLRGLQFHTSWNLDPRSQVRFIEKLGGALQELDAQQRVRIEFIDIGGGFWPPQGEWLQPAGTPEGKVRHAVLDPSPTSTLPHHRLPASSIERFAHEIGQAFRTHVFPHVACRIYTEPGRWLCNDAMHTLLTVIDKKALDMVITDAGTNAIGWERFEVDYFPVINLSRPALTEHPCYIMGSLCTPHDVWGYAYYGESIEAGDVLLIPTQGAYTYSLRQEFIKPLPKVAVLEP